MSSKYGIIDVGGGLRGIYGSGVTDYCLLNNIKFDYAIGVSAGSANLSSFIAGQYGRSYIFYAEYAFRNKYMSLHNFIHKGSYIDMDYVYGVLSNSDGENPLDYSTFHQSSCDMKVVACNALTGEPIYFSKEEMLEDKYDPLKASCSIPVVCKPYMIHDIPCYDGGIVDPIPMDKAFADGCDKVVLVLTKPLDTVRNPKKDEPIARKLSKKYPKAAERVYHRAETYNNQIAKAKEYVNQGKLLIVAPDDCCGLDTLTKSKESMENMYKKGLKDAESIKSFLL